jgi:hypothetical protein
MKKFLVIKVEEDADYFHSIIQAESLKDASNTFGDSEEYKVGTIYEIYPLVDYYFNENKRLVVPPNTEFSAIQAFKVNEK